MSAQQAYAYIPTRLMVLPYLGDRSTRLRTTTRISRNHIGDSHILRWLHPKDSHTLNLYLTLINLSNTPTRIHPILNLSHMHSHSRSRRCTLSPSPNPILIHMPMFSMPNTPSNMITIREIESYRPFRTGMTKKTDTVMNPMFRGMDK
jgi:hypothetical protein